jgi:thiol-disulfide isomerase/thioredoxin
VTSGLRIPVAIAIICIGGATGFLAAHLGRIARTQGIVDTLPTKPPPEGVDQPARQNEPEGGGASRARAIPTDVPDVSLADADGARHSLIEWKGRPMLINFWATWCEPCRREIPLLKKLRHDRSTDGLQIVGIAVDLRDAVRQYARQMGIDYPVLIGEQDGLDAVAAFGMDAVFPFSVFVDARGRIVTLKVGELHADDASLILDTVNDIDRGRIELAAARKQLSDAMAALAAQRARTE